MISSIRTFLVINLLLSIALITSLSVVTNLYLEHRQMQKTVDSRLVETAIDINAFLESHASDRTPKSHALSMPENTINPAKDKNASYVHADCLPTQYQVYGRDGQLLLRSRQAPQSTMRNNDSGFNHLTLDGTPWRTYTFRNNTIGATIIVGESYSFMQSLERRITQDAVIIMLVTYPLLAALIWVIVGRGFEGVKRLAKEVSERDERHRLQPISLAHIPQEIKPFIDELNHLFSRLDETFQSQKRFAGDAAHELRTPLAVLKTQAQVALKTKDPQEAAHAIKHIMTGVERCTHIVNQLLTMSKMVPEATMNDIHTIDLTALSVEIMADLAPKAIDKSIDIELIEPLNPVRITGNKTAIQILMRNLIHNAITYTPNKGQVAVKIFETEGKQYFVVEDNGPGISPELRERVFERFYRITGHKATGSGLGLGIVRKIADLHQADVQLQDSKQGCGLKVVVIFSQAIPPKPL